MKIEYMCDVCELIGKKIKKTSIIKVEYDDRLFTFEVTRDNEKVYDSLLFELDNGDSYLLFFDNQGPCYVACVDVELLEGSLDDLCDTVVVDSSQETVDSEYGLDGWSYDSGTATFTKIVTEKGYVTVIFRTASNGHYCEETSFAKLVTGAV